MGETYKSILPLNKVSDLKKKVLFTLNIFKKPFWRVVLFLSFSYIYIYKGNEEFVVFCVCIIVLIENEIKMIIFNGVNNNSLWSSFLNFRQCSINEV